MRMLSFVGLLAVAAGSLASVVGQETKDEVGPVRVVAAKQSQTSTVSTETPFANSDGLKETAKTQILNEVGVAIKKIQTVQDGVDELKKGQKTTHDLIRGIGSLGLETSGSFASAKAEIQEACEKSLAQIKAKGQEIENGLPIVAEKSFGAVMDGRGYTKPSATPQGPVLAGPAVTVDSTSTSVSSTSGEMWTNHNEDGSLGSIPCPKGQSKPACKFCNQTGPCTGINYAASGTTNTVVSNPTPATIVSNSAPATAYVSPKTTSMIYGYPLGQVVPSGTTCTSGSCANGSTCASGACRTAPATSTFYSN